MIDVNDFNREAECIYKDERYSVRDNGAVLRHPRDGKRPRPTDNQWTFGKLIDKTGYMEIASVRVHRIVASAFLGEPPPKEHVVDHIDTNKRNNRPENLRWVTRLENVLLNPITAKRIAFVCGSVEAFLADPTKYRHLFSEPYEQWMQTVSAEEAQISLERMLAWANSDKQRSSGLSLDKWIFNRPAVQYSPVETKREETNIRMSLTPNAAQKIYFLEDKPNEYPCTPQKYSGDPLTAYAANLIENAVFWRNHNRDREYVVVKYGFSEDHQSLYVMTKSAYVWRGEENGETILVPIINLKKEEIGEDEINYQLAEIIYEDNLFVHKRVETGFMPKEHLYELFAKYTHGN